MLTDEEIKDEWHRYQEWLATLDRDVLLSPFERDRRLCKTQEQITLKEVGEWLDKVMHTSEGVRVSRADCLCSTEMHIWIDMLLNGMMPRMSCITGGKMPKEKSE